MFLKKLRLLNFRSYGDLSITFPPQGALLEGLNGTGKTNLLESIFLLCTGRSQRGAQRAAMIRHEEEAAFVEGDFFCGDGLRPSASGGEDKTVNVALGFGRDKKIVMKRDGAAVNSFSEWFGERPVVSFGSDDLDLVYGAPELRRRFADMLICQMDRSYMDALSRYRKSLACRNALFGKTSDPLQFEVYEREMAAAGAELVFRRAEVLGKLSMHLSDFYAQISECREVAGMEYEQKFKCDFNSKNEWKNVYLELLGERRIRDSELGFTAYGPHRDDLRFFLDKKPAKTFASQGQCRSFALSLKLGSVLLLEQQKQDSMIFLIDDAVSELDSGRTSRVYPLLEGRGQIFIATPHCQVTLRERVLKCAVELGKVKWS
ncbi:MAG: DNA replication and repair protein RecF [Chitinispirillales bacterium]|jgi:DNA replication and repair protein RecF|nr:DNA replication and repair protein RecF [Chitinispirillales bacterium]